MENEDVPYTVGDHATPEPDRPVDPDQTNKSILVELSKYLTQAIAQHNSFDVIDLTGDLTLTGEQQIAVHKVVVNHLRNIKTDLDNKIKELK